MQGHTHDLGLAQTFACFFHLPFHLTFNIHRYGGFIQLQ